ncbi:MAG: hypothetical protein K6A73_00810 [Bacteroidales bacterium]|nr:hypothetical protein [Bacteroidales bacterium]
MKCPHCGLDIIKPSYKFCPSCRKPVNNIASDGSLGQTIRKEAKGYGEKIEHIYFRDEESFNRYKEEMGESKAFGDFFRRKPQKPEPITSPDLEVVKNKVVWNLYSGEIARRINIDEFDRLSNVKGVYIQEGVKALLIVDGNTILEFGSGLYYLAGRIERAGTLLHRIFDFFRGRKEDENEHERDMRRNRLDIALQSLKGNSVVEVILVSEGYIPVVLNTVEKNGTQVFEPYIIPTHLSDLEMGVSLNMQITDYRQFVMNYLNRNRTFRIADLQYIIKDIVCNELKRLFVNKDIQSTVIPVDMDGLARSSIKNCVNMNLFGIEVIQVVDVTMDNKDFMRFRELEHKLYCSQNELDYLIRTNTFRNRLQDEKNSQIVREAKSEEELRYALQQVNKDSLLHDDEFDAFVDLLESQRRLRKATTQEEEYEALLRIKKNQLVADDDFAVLENEMFHRQLNRDEVDSVLIIQSNRRILSERIESDKLLNIQGIRGEQEIEEAQYEADTQKQKHGYEKEGRDWEQDEKRQIHNIHMDDVEGEHQSRVDDRDIEHKEKYSTFAYSERVRDHRQDVVEERDTIETDDLRDQKEFELTKKYSDLAMGNQKQMSEIEIREKEADSRLKMQEEAQRHQHEEEMKRLDAVIMESKGKLSADQLMALQLKDLSHEAQKAFAEALSSSKEIELQKMTTGDRIAMYEKMARMSEDYANSNVKNQQAMMEKMMLMMQDAMHTNADVAKTAVSGQNANIKAQLDTMVEISTHRQNELMHDKEEYREEAHSNRDYARHTADTAMNYTTEANRGRSAAEVVGSMVASGKVQKFVVNGLGEFTLDGILNMIDIDAIQPFTRITIDGTDRMAQHIDVLRDRLLKKHGKTCPNCGKGVFLEGETCPECGK